MDNLFVSKVTKVGTSLAVVIPVAVLRGLKIERGDRLSFAVYEDQTFVCRLITDVESAALKPKQIT